MEFIRHLGLSIKIILLAGLKHQLSIIIENFDDSGLSIKIILLAGLKQKWIDKIHFYKRPGAFN